MLNFVNKLRRGNLGELWVDSAGALKRLERLRCSEYLKEKILFFIENGYVIFEKEVSSQICDEIINDVNSVYDSPENYVVRNRGIYVDPAELSGGLGVGDRIIDLYSISNAARKAVFSENVANFMHAVFSESAIAMQELYFEYGSQQAVHQDTAYVISKSPLSLMASWIALEDVSEGDGELIYYPKSHRFKHFYFGDKQKGWSKNRDGDELHRKFLDQLHDQAQARGLKLTKFLPKKGDVLLWHADLAHGGSRRKNTSTRKSLVTHFVPKTVKPKYTEHLKSDYYEHPSGNGHFFSSRHYKLSDLKRGSDASIIYDAGVSARRAQNEEV